MFRSLASAALVLALVAVGAAGPSGAASVADIKLPRTIAPQGTTLTLAGCDSREKLWMDLYAVALYLPRPGMAKPAILADDTPKAVLVFPTYDGELPDEIPGSWGERLQANLSAEHMAVFRQYFERLNTRDTATVTYRPGHGTVLMINDQVFRTVEGGRMMNGIMQTWLGPDDPIQLLSGC